MNASNNDNKDATIVFSRVESVTFAAFLTLILMMAMFGNALVVWVSLVKRPRANMIDLFIASLASGDILLSFSRLSNVAALLGQGWKSESYQCKVFGFLQTVAVSVSLHSLALIAVNRYVIICNNKAHFFFTRRKSEILISIVWIFGVFLAIPPFFGWSEYRYFPPTANCYFSQSSSPSYHGFHITFTFIVPTLTLAVCYWKIFKRLRSHRHATISINESRSKEKFWDIKMTNTLFLIGFSFVVSYFPPALAGIVATAMPGGSVIIRMVGVMVHYFASVTHPIVYGFMNPRLRRTFSTAAGLNCSLRRSRKTVPFRTNSVS